MLEVKGDFCHDVRSILDGAGRGDDYLELGMGGLWKWNPLSAWWLDSYSLAYTVASLLNQLFGKGKEPFWQQAYTNLVRWIIELHRVLPEQWVTLQQVYQCAIDPDLFAAKIKQAEAWSAELNTGQVFIPVEKWDEKMVEVGEWAWMEMPGGDETRAEWSPELEHKLKELGIKPRIVWEPGAGDDVRERVAAVKRWFDSDWQKLDNKIKSSIVEGVSVFLSMFDMPDVAAVFCPPPPEVSDDPRRIGPKARAAMLAKAKAQAEGQGEDSAEKKAQESRQWPGDTIAGRPRYLPPLYELIEGGKVLALNMPAGSNPALARAIGVMLKNAWLQALLMRPAQMKESPSTYFRPAVFICDEYQSFASVGEDDPTGDEKSFALTRQCRCIPIVATQSISSLRAVLGSSEAWRALLQTLRTRIFLSLSDDASRQDRIGIVRAGCQDQRIVHDQRDLEAGGRVPAIGPGGWIGRKHRRNQVFPGAPGGRLSPARLHLACETVRPFACPMTERNRSNPGGSISNLITFPWIILIGEQRRPDRYEQRGQRACTPETFFARA